MEGLAAEELASLLEKTSRTFALAIPLLPKDLARQVGAAYLVFRIADTLEDAPLWGRDTRLAALHSFAAWIVGGTDEGWKKLVASNPPIADACMDLLARADAVKATVSAFDAPVRQVIVAHAHMTALGMADFVARQDEKGSLVLSDAEDLRAYCYVVAGIVGEMLTQLFVVASPALRAVEPDLASRARAFGEGLQLVNILKDASSDAKEGRAYLPPSVPREEVVRMARADLERASEYVDLLGRDPARPFCELPVHLAVATLDRLDEGKPKLARDEVRRIHDAVTGRSR
jgi:farnesyl-diphosphate farnesyltransferase